MGWASWTENEDGGSDGSRLPGAGLEHGLAVLEIRGEMVGAWPPRRDRLAQLNLGLAQCPVQFLVQRFLQRASAIRLVRVLVAVCHIWDDRGRVNRCSCLLVLSESYPTYSLAALVDPEFLAQLARRPSLLPDAVEPRKHRQPRSADCRGSRAFHQNEP